MATESHQWCVYLHRLVTWSVVLWLVWDNLILNPCNWCSVDFLDAWIPYSHLKLVFMLALATDDDTLSLVLSIEARSGLTFHFRKEKYLSGLWLFLVSSRLPFCVRCKMTHCASSWWVVIRAVTVVRLKLERVFTHDESICLLFLVWLLILGSWEVLCERTRVEIGNTRTFLFGFLRCYVLVFAFLICYSFRWCFRSGTWDVLLYCDFGLCKLYEYTLVLLIKAMSLYSHLLASLILWVKQSFQVWIESLFTIRIQEDKRILSRGQNVLSFLSSCDGGRICSACAS